MYLTISNLETLQVRIRRNLVRQTTFVILLFFIQQLSAFGILADKVFFFNLYSISYILSLTTLIYISKGNKLSFLLALSCLIYFYQVPFLDLYSNELANPKYRISVSNTTYSELFSIYSIVILIYFFICQIILKSNLKIDLIINEMRDSKSINLLFYCALFFNALYIYLTIDGCGGIANYLLLNKFEASKAQVFFLLDFKKFSAFTIIFGFLSRSKFINFMAIIILLGLCGVEIVSAKRFLVLILLIIVFLIRVKKVKLSYLPIVYLGIFLMTVLKTTYYSLRLFVLGQITFSDIFYFKWSDIFFETLLIGEGQAHIVQFSHFIQYNMSFEPFYFFKLLTVSIPFGHQLVSDYQTAGAFLQSSYNISWGGLASALYLTPYLSLGILGIVLIYFIYISLVQLSLYLLKLKSLFIRVLLFSNFPVLFFYFQREELIIIGKSFSIHGMALFLIFFLCFLLKKILLIFKSNHSLISMKS